MPITPPTAPIRLRQIALVVSDLPRAKELIPYVLSTELLYVDPLVSQWGLENALYSLGGDFLEIVSPFRPDTTASRLLSKRGDGGYMIIMQTSNAAARREYLKESGLARVIFEHDGDESICVQYHPRGIKGGVIPELDSHFSSPENPQPLTKPFSPWHACGPSTLYLEYSKVMSRNSHLQLQKVVCRLASDDTDVEGAATQWKNLFGIDQGEGKNSLQYLNASLEFVLGKSGFTEGIDSITIGVTGRANLERILNRAKQRGVLNDVGIVEMCGLKWIFQFMRETSKI